jgi:hypothetical protein
VFKANQNIPTMSKKELYDKICEALKSKAQEEGGEDEEEINDASE